MRKRDQSCLEPLADRSLRHASKVAHLASNLPVDILSHLIGYLPRHGLLAAASLVCKFWRTAALRTIGGIDKISSINDPLESADLQRLQRLTSLEASEIRGNPAALPHLRRLKLLITPNVDCSAFFLRSTSLLELDLRIIGVEDQSDDVSSNVSQLVATVKGTLTNLKVLGQQRDLNSFHGFPFSAVSFPRLKSLLLDLNYEDPALGFLQRHVSQLTSLSIHGFFQQSRVVFPHPFPQLHLACDVEGHVPLPAATQLTVSGCGKMGAMIAELCSPAYLAISPAVTKLRLNLEPEAESGEILRLAQYHHLTSLKVIASSESVQQLLYLDQLAVKTLLRSLHIISSRLPEPLVLPAMPALERLESDVGVTVQAPNLAHLLLRSRVKDAVYCQFDKPEQDVIVKEIDMCIDYLHRCSLQSLTFAFEYRYDACMYEELVKLIEVCNSASFHHLRIEGPDIPREVFVKYAWVHVKTVPYQLYEYSRVER